jgi:ankyrin repeat protein
MGVKMNIFDAVRTGDLEILKTYIKYGGNIDNTIVTGSTLLMIAATYGQSEAAEILIDAGAEVNAVNYGGMTALMFSMLRTSNIETVRLLIKAKADVNASFTRSTSDGMTSLMLAAGSGQEETVGILIEAGADVNAHDNDGKTAIDRAAENGHSGIVNLLKAAGGIGT